MQINQRTAALFALAFGLLTGLLVAGCHTARPDMDKPAMGPGQGAISGQLIDTNDQPFDLKQAGDGGAEALRIDLISPATGVTAAAYPGTEHARFSFPNVPPGRYELSVYWVVPGKRTIAGSLPVTVNPDQITPVKLTLTVTPQDR